MYSKILKNDKKEKSVENVIKMRHEHIGPAAGQQLDAV